MLKPLCCPLFGYVCLLLGFKAIGLYNKGIRVEQRSVELDETVCRCFCADEQGILG